MDNLDTLLKAKGIKKTWFIREVMKIPVGSFYSQRKTGRLPQAAIERTIKYLGITFEELTKPICSSCHKFPVEQAGLCCTCFEAFALEIYEEHLGINEKQL